MSKINSSKFCLLFIASLIIIYFLSNQIDRFNVTFTSQKGIDSSDILEKMLGESRFVLSKLSLIKSEEYLHGGISHPLCQSAFLGAKVDEKHDEHHHENDSDHNAHLDRPKINLFSDNISKWDILPQLAQVVKVDAHIHLSGKEAKEVVPWYVYATKLNPHNIRAFLIGGYWISRGLHEPDKGLRFLSDGLKLNPGSWEITSEIAVTYLAEKKDFVSALKYFLKTIEYLRNTKDNQLEKRAAFRFAAYCYEELGKPEAAAALLKEMKSF